MAARRSVKTKTDDCGSVVTTAARVGAGAGAGTVPVTLCCDGIATGNDSLTFCASRSSERWVDRLNLEITPGEGRDGGQPRDWRLERDNIAMSSDFMAGAGGDALRLVSLYPHLPGALDGSSTRFASLVIRFEQRAANSVLIADICLRTSRPCPGAGRCANDNSYRGKQHEYL
ncbi:hypothetical protein [Rhodobacter lacus]